MAVSRGCGHDDFDDGEEVPSELGHLLLEVLGMPSLVRRSDQDNLQTSTEAE